MVTDNIVKGKRIVSDNTLIEPYKKERANIAFLDPKTRELINELKNETSLNIQSEHLINLWKEMVGDAIVYLKKQDTREKYHDEMKLGIDELHKYLDQFQSFETILYGAIDNYRDHIVHVFRTYLLGDYLIRNSIDYDSISSTNIKIDKTEKEAMWCLISLTHDLGYPLQGINEINNKVREIIKKYGHVSIKELEFTYYPQFEKICEFAIKFMSSTLIPKPNDKYAIHVQPKYYQKFMTALSRLNHGVLSSIILMKDLVYFKESDYMMDEHKYLDVEDARQFLIRRDMLRAISSHSCEDIYYLTIPNFSFLLTAFDEMQEWGRPRLVDVTKRGGSVTELLINDFINEKIDYKITFRFPDNYTPNNSEKEAASKEVMMYFESKKRKWLNVLRSAVGGTERNLTLKFETEDLTSDIVKNYELYHENPEEYKIKYPE